MRINCQNCLNFGEIYYGTNGKKLTKSQTDVIDDITYYMETKDYVNRLEKLGYDVYLESGNDNYSIGMAFVKNAKINKKNEFVYDKIVTFGKFIIDAGLKYKPVQDACSTDRLNDMISCFFNKEANGKYKRYINYL